MFRLLYFLLLLAVSNYGSGSHIYLFWQKNSVELITIGSRPALRGHPSTFFGVFATPQFVQALFTVYLLYELKVPGPSRKRPRPKNKRQCSNPWRPKCSEGSCIGHEKRSGRCLALNATASMFDNFVWLPRACAPDGVRSKKAIRTSLFLSDCVRQARCQK